jgi:hypothetical protein
VEPLATAISLDACRTPLSSGLLEVRQSLTSRGPSSAQSFSSSCSLDLDKAKLTIPAQSHLSLSSSHLMVELHPNSFKDEVCVNGKSFEPALYHLERVGTLMNGHRGLDLGVHAGISTPDLDSHKVTRNKGHLVSRHGNWIVSHGGKTGIGELG